MKITPGRDAWHGADIRTIERDRPLRQPRKVRSVHPIKPYGGRKFLFNESNITITHFMP